MLSGPRCHGGIWRARIVVKCRAEVRQLPYTHGADDDICSTRGADVCIPEKLATFGVCLLRSASAPACVKTYTGISVVRFVLVMACPIALKDLRVVEHAKNKDHGFVKTSFGGCVAQFLFAAARSLSEPHLARGQLGLRKQGEYNKDR